MTNDEIAKIENYYEIIIPMQSDASFRSHFRMNKATFEIVLNNIARSHQFEKRDEVFGGREQINPEKSLLITLWVLATPDSYRSVGDRFNVGKSTVFVCLNKVINAILEKLSSKVIKWPSQQEYQSIAQRFNRYGLPNVIGAIDGCHIPIKKPSEHSEDYFNRKKFYSMVLQAVCRHDMLFTDCDIRWPGSVHDGRVAHLMYTPLQVNYVDQIFI